MTSRATKKNLLIMAAGTGGHIFPGLAIAELMQARGWHVTWLGTKKGMEAQIVAGRGISMDLLDFSGLRGKGLMHAVSGTFKLGLSFISCFKIIWQRKPDVVLGMGGYVTVPGGVSSFLLGKPLALMNADAPLLLSNRVLKIFAKKLMFGLPAKSEATGNKVPAKLVTGNPIRREIADLPEPASRYRARNGVLRILVVGGSLGAKALNECVPAALALIPTELRPVVTHQSGQQHLETLRMAYQAAGVEAEVLAFIDDMPQRYAQADLVICRAGAITVSELTAAGVASILVPLVASSTSHQRANAEWLSSLGGGIYLAQSDLNQAALAQVLQGLDRNRCLEMAQAAYAQGRRDASETIAQILEELT